MKSILALLFVVFINQVAFSQKSIYSTPKRWYYDFSITDAQNALLHYETAELVSTGNKFNGQSEIIWHNRGIISTSAKTLASKYNPRNIDISLYQKDYKSTSGAIEKYGKKPHIWIHPTREAFFVVTELCPFPEIYLNLDPNTTWNSEISGLKGFGTWDGLIIKSEYKYLGSAQNEAKETVYKVSAVSTSAQGTCKADFEFTTTSGFTLMDYTLPDQNRFSFKLLNVVEE